MNLKVFFALYFGFNLGIIFMNIPPVLNNIMGLYKTSYRGISILLSALFWSHASVQLLAGLIVDHLGVKRAITVSLIFIIFGNALASILQIMSFAVVSRIITGIGTGISFVSIMKMLAVSSPNKHTGAYQSFFGGFFSLGSIAAYLILPFFYFINWRFIYWLPLINFLFLLAFLYFFKFPYELEELPTNSPLPLSKIIGSPIGWVIGIYHALSYGSVINLGNWITSLMAEFWENLPTIKLSWIGAIIMLVSGIGRLAGGFIIFYIASYKIANFSILILSFIFLALFLVNTPFFVLSLVIMVAFFASINFGAFFHLASKSVDGSSIGSLIGFINFLANIGAILFTLVFGFLKENLGTFSWGFVFLSFLSLSVVIFSFKHLQKSINPGSHVNFKKHEIM